MASGDIIVAVSHELRQPLASIRGFTEMLLGHWSDFADSERVEMLKQILHEAERVGRLMDELLSVSRLESGPLPLNRRMTDLAELVARVVRNLQHSCPALDVSVELPELFPALLVDPFKLEQVLGNILENACKYGSPGTVRVNGRTSAGGNGRNSPPASEVEIAVSDRGSGILPEDLPHVAEKFYRAAQSEQNGLGLGLWISKGIVEAHGGALTISSVPGEGTTVRFTIPLHHGTGTGKLAGS